VPVRLMGAATGTLTFFRQVGGSIGLAVAGTVFNQQFATQLPGQLIGAGVSPGVANSIATSPTRGALTGVGAATGSPNVVAGVHNAFAAATADIFWVGAVAAAVAMVAVLFIREVPLRGRVDAEPAPDATAPLPAQAAA
jgi:hypothetical protein